MTPVFNSTEKRAIIKVAHQMIAADGKAKTQELLMTVAVCSKIGVVESDFDAAAELSNAKAISILSNLTTPKKQFVSAFLGWIMISDGDIDSKEHVLWCLISGMCGFPTMSIADCKNLIDGIL